MRKDIRINLTDFRIVGMKILLEISSNQQKANPGYFIGEIL